MTRLKLYYGDQSLASLMRYLGIPTSTYSNWRKRGTVTYDHLVQGLIRAGISLDWFFAPQRQLDYPRPSQLHLAESNGGGYQRQQNDTNEVLAALAEVKPYLQRYQLSETQVNQSLLLQTYLAARADHVSVDFALDKVAQALRVCQKEQENAAQD
ncbi:helix-turn-helix domain-containing protein [Pseudidiomarina insulisalsae]|uniref:helix-turn-helix domain-containing protein n=1 Tax=Pseudidiomarina insulisalsae TaxID=575789 RepID=UPI0013007F24|nr:helix-turn-helix domain-containing protein [Pseudidiomarina insulisalsae]